LAVLLSTLLFPQKTHTSRQKQLSAYTQFLRLFIIVPSLLLAHSPKCFTLFPTRLTLRAQRCRDCGRRTLPCHAVPISHGSTAISEKNNSHCIFTGLISLLSEYPSYVSVDCPHSASPVCTLVKRSPNIMAGFLYVAILRDLIPAYFFSSVWNSGMTRPPNSFSGSLNSAHTLAASCPQRLIPHLHSVCSAHLLNSRASHPRPSNFQ
jgi:hypothetical protein